MPNKFIIPKTDTATRTGATPLEGEILYDTDTDKVYSGDGVTAGGQEIGAIPLDPLTLPHTSTPADPGAGKTAVYAKDDGLIYKLAAGGVEEAIGTGTGGGASLTDIWLYGGF